MTSVNYIVISPVRNEQDYIQNTIQSLASQTNRPALWIIVDDGSIDKTGGISDEAASRHSWIRVLHRQDRGFRRAGSGVMEAFHDGFKLIEGRSWQYLVKLDGDVTLEADYFERCFARFAADPRLGIAGGLVCNLVNGTLCAESSGDPPFHVRGATKIYKYECWQAIGGLMPVTGWDTLDELKANMLGWATQTFPDIKLVHHRPAGGAYGTWSNWVKNGYANYVAGYHPLFMFVKCAKRFFEKPYLIGALGLWVGFLNGYLKRAPQVGDPSLIRYFRRQQMQRLLGRRSLWSQGVTGGH
jgi:poly-beta-1,6-N-acetyl-D-glucosamine synthase